jgi:hypothetical protein
MKLAIKEQIEAALFEQHRWEFNCEAIYRKGLRSDPVDKACLDDMLKMFGIARTLSKKGKLQLMKSLPRISETHKKAPKDWESIFQVTNDCCNHDLYIEGSQTRPKEGRPRVFISGLTKVLWFAGTHRMPMFDTLTCKAVRPSGRTGAEKAANFYKLLDDVWEYGCIFDRLENVRKSSKPSWCFFPERFIDKLLLFKGRKPEDFLMGSDSRRNSYLSALKKPAREELEAMVPKLCEALECTHFYKNILKCPPN